MRNILARHSAMAVVLAVVAMPLAAAAADLFWYCTDAAGLAVKIVGSPSGLSIFVR